MGLGSFQLGKYLLSLIPMGLKGFSCWGKVDEKMNKV
jgi:hypothetical protein